MNDPALAEGTTLGNRYVVDRVIAVQDGAIIYSALDLHLHRRVVLHERVPAGAHRSTDGAIRTQTADHLSPSARAAFMEAVRRPSHSGVSPNVFAAFDAHNTLYIVSDEMDGTVGRSATRVEGSGSPDTTDVTRLAATRYSDTAPPAGKRSPSTGRSVAALAAITIAAIALGGLAAAFVLRSSPQPEEPGASASAVAGSTAASEHPTGPSAEPASAINPTSAEFAATVDGTNGEDDVTNRPGEGFLSMRSSPSSRATELGRIYEGNRLLVRCQVTGTAATSAKYGRSEVWAKLTNGNYVAMIFLRAPDLSRYETTVPC